MTHRIDHLPDDPDADTGTPERPAQMPAEPLTMTCQGGWVGNGIAKCQRPATTVVRIHVLDKCDSKGATSDGETLDAEGNRVKLCCDACVQATAISLVELIEELYERIPKVYPCRSPECDGTVRFSVCQKCGLPTPPVTVCLTCMKTVVSLHDLLDTERI